MNWTNLLATIGLLALSLCATQAQTVTATLSNTDTVGQGEVLQLIFRFENVDADGFELPELVGLTPYGGPSRQSSMTFINGERTSSSAFVYRVVAEQPGIGYVPAVTVMHEDQELKTEPLQVFITEDAEYVPMKKNDESQREPLQPKKRKRPIVKM